MATSQAPDPRPELQQPQYSEGGPRRTVSVKEFRRHYDAGLAYLNDRHAFFLTHVLNMGRPKASM